MSQQWNVFIEAEILAASLRRLTTEAACLTSYWCDITLHIQYIMHNVKEVPVCEMREHIVGVHILKCIQSLHCYWHEGYRADIKVIIRQALTTSLSQTAQWERHLVRGGTQAVAVSLRDCPLTWRNTQIHMDWLWRWLESYNNCTFSTWKDKFLFNLLFWICNSFCTFHDYARGGTPFPDGPSLIFYHADFCSEKQSCPETFHCVEIFFIFQDFWATCGLPWKTVCPEFTVLNIRIFNHSEFWTTCACPEK